MQYPAANAHPFEFARPILLLVALSFFVGFGGYMAVHPAPPVSVARQSVQTVAAPTPATTVSTPTAAPASVLRKI
jgi:hypothetical protein